MTEDAPEQPVDVSILVVTYRNPELTRRCLQSVLDETHDVSWELLVLDNASGDGTAELVRDAFPRARLTALEENVGFAAGNNELARQARGRYLLLLNPDTVVHDGAVQELVAFARRHPAGGLFGGRTLRPSGELDPSSAWAQQTLWSLLCFATGLSTFRSRSALLNPEAMPRYRRDSVREVDVVTGCLALIERTLWERLGGFDTRFWMYGEDADLSRRVWDLGYRPLLDPDAVVTHVVGASSRDPGPKLALVLRAKVSLLRKHWPRPRAALGVALLHAGVWLRARGDRGGSKPWTHVWAVRREWRSGFGH